MLGTFWNMNRWLSRKLDGFLLDLDDQRRLRAFASQIRDDDEIADVGGGKKPVKNRLPRFCAGKRYDGIDIDEDELRRAKDQYTSVHAIDITAVPAELHAQYDKIICMNTLEHVDDAERSMAGISAMLKPGGQAYIKVPCSSAIFARLNLLLPENLKRRALHAFFPDKSGDGFPAYYKGCTPSEMKRNASMHGLAPEGEEKRIYTSSYFMIFVPFYLIWRLATGLQFVFDRDYCESFEIVFRKSDAA